MSGIIIPTRLKDRLDEEWSAIVHQFIRNTDGIFANSPYFFPEYTRHDIFHINNVLRIADNLIHKDTLKELTPATVGVFLMATISHDIGMFLKPDGLKCVLKDKKWGYRWAEYGISLQHFSGVEITACFGPQTELDRLELPQDFDRLTPWQIRICGEFLRRYHPLLAQDIIKKGFLGYEIQNLFDGIVLHSKERYCALIALIARSHGMSMDEVEPTLKILDDRKPEFSLQIPVYYLMTLLRLADYLDAGSDRAPHAIPEMQHFESQISLEEFHWNKLVELKEVWGSSGDESEFIEVDTDKIDSKTFLKIENWLKALQRELDICWRYLALKYENKYQTRYLLNIRSIDSNILQNTPRQILEERIVIDAAAISVNPKITDLLVVPLYGDEPAYGVRELLQNALDACRERKLLEQRLGNVDYEGNVIIEVNSKSNPPYFCIIDNGTGMTKNVILNYFLVAGSSYRDNPSWKKIFQGKNVCRSGRFGVGVLAAFLLGYKIQVETLPIGEEKAYFFQIENNNYEHINIERKEPETDALLQNGGGTRILIEMDFAKASSMVLEFPTEGIKSFGNKQHWFEWYILDSPKVYYLIDKNSYKNSDAIHNKFSELKKREKWYKLQYGHPFDQVYWSPAIIHNSLSEPIIVCCNGIMVESDFNGEGIRTDYDLPLKHVSLSFMDSQNSMDINLTRTKLQSIPDSLNKSLYLECCKMAIALLVVLNLDYKDYLNPFFSEESIIFGNIGYSIAMRRLWKKMAKKTLWQMRLTGYPVHYIEFQEFCNDEVVCNIIRPGIMMQDLSRSPRKPVLGEIRFEHIPFCMPPESDKKRKFPISVDDKNAYLIPDNIETLPDVEAVLSDLLGDEVWIPYDLAERKKKFPWFFEPNDRRFTYVKGACNEDCTYDLKTIMNTMG